MYTKTSKKVKVKYINMSDKTHNISLYMVTHLSAYNTFARLLSGY